MNQTSTDLADGVAPIESFRHPSQEIERKKSVEAIWEQMNKGVSAAMLKPIYNESNTTTKPVPQNNEISHGWVRYLGMASEESDGHRSPTLQNGSSNEVKEPATAAALAVENPAPFYQPVKGNFEGPRQANARSSPIQTSDVTERKARIDAVWEQMNKGVPTRIVKSFSNELSSTLRAPQCKNSDGWMSNLGLSQKRPESNGDSTHEMRSPSVKIGRSDEIKKIAASALAAAKENAAAGKVEITEVRDFAGQDIEVKKLVDPNSAEGKASAGPSSAVDAVLEQIRKKPKLSVLDKTKKDWGEFKEEHKGLEDELGAYRKSSNQYLDKVSFLQRSDYRAFERERDARLALQSKRRPDMREDP